MASIGNRGAGTYEVDPVSRIEGHLGIKVTTDASGIITDALAHGNLWRGFENFLLGRDVNDAITFTQRICGVCPVPHGLTATYAADTVLGYSKGHITFAYDGTWGVPKKAVLIRNLVLSAEFLMSSITHFYHLAAPSYVQGPAMPPWTPYFNDEYYASLLRNNLDAAVPDTNPATQKLWDAVILSYVKALKIRRKTFEAGALFAGRMPMTSCFVAGGVTNDGTESLLARCNEFEALIREVGLFIVNEYVPIVLALGALYQGFDSQTMDLATEHTTTPKAGNRGFGGGIGRFLAWGGFPNLDDSLTLPGGIKDASGEAGALAQVTVANKTDVYNKFLAGGTDAVPANLTEDISNSRYEKYADDVAAYATTAARPYATSTSSYPGDITRTKPKRSNGYTYLKGPRWKGKACEVGPLARMAVAGIYPVDGTTLTAIPGYKEIYTVNGDGTGGIDGRVLASEIVNGLTNDGVLVPVAEWILGLKGGLSTMDRLRARAIESLVLVQAMVGTVSKDVGTGALSFADDGWIHQLMCLTDAAYAAASVPNVGWGLAASNAVGSTWRSKTMPVGTVQGWGANEAPRGALMHQAKITNGKIVSYQCIVPTTWNGSPSVGLTSSGSRLNRGAFEAAMIDVPFAADTQTFVKANGDTSAATQGGVEVLRIAQSFDPCIACAVH